MNARGGDDVEINPGARFTIAVNVLPSSVGAIVEFKVKTETGLTQVYMLPNDADAVAELLHSRAKLARSGIVLPPGVGPPGPEKAGES